MPHTAGGTPALPSELPVFGPLGLILVGGGIDGQRNEALEEMLAARPAEFPVEGSCLERHVAMLPPPPPAGLYLLTVAAVHGPTANPHPQGGAPLVKLWHMC